MCVVTVVWYSLPQHFPLSHTYFLSHLYMVQSIGPMSVKTTESKASYIKCDHFDPFTPAKAQNVIFRDEESIHKFDSICDDAMFLELIKQRKLQFSNSSKSNASQASDLTNPETGIAHSGDYPFTAGLKWRQSRGRSGASAVSSLSSVSLVSSDGQTSYRSTREIQLSRKYQFIDMSEQLNSMKDELITNAVLNEEDEFQSPSPRPNQPFSGKKSSDKNPESTIWTPARTMGLAGRNWSPFKKMSSVAACPEDSAQSNDKEISADQSPVLEVKRKSSSSGFSFKKLVPKFIRKRRWSIGGQSPVPPAGGEPVMYASQASATLRDNQENLHGRNSVMRRRGTV